MIRQRNVESLRLKNTYVMSAARALNPLPNDSQLNALPLSYKISSATSTLAKVGPTAEKSSNQNSCELFYNTRKLPIEN